jgi:hypothetical protein
MPRRRCPSRPISPTRCRWWSPGRNIREHLTPAGGRSRRRAPISAGTPRAAPTSPPSWSNSSPRTPTTGSPSRSLPSWDMCFTLPEATVVDSFGGRWNLEPPGDGWILCSVSGLDARVMLLWPTVATALTGRSWTRSTSGRRGRERRTGSGAPGRRQRPAHTRMSPTPARRAPGPDPAAALRLPRQHRGATILAPHLIGKDLQQLARSGVGLLALDRLRIQAATLPA